MRELFREFAEFDLEHVFAQFYDVMLSNKDFARFFKDDEQIKSLVARQAKFLLDSISVSDDEMKMRYVKIGEMHHDIKVPYVDYMAGITILQEGLAHTIVEQGRSLQLLDESTHFFKLVRAFTAKGYLNRMLEADMRDIDLYLVQVKRASDVDTSLSTERMLWLKSVIAAIKSENRDEAPALDFPADVMQAVQLATRGDTVLTTYVQEIASRMAIDARNIFYFLDRHSYEEVLPLYRELMSIYKLSLMLSNVVTIASANALVQTLQRDALTGLLTRHALHPVFRRELAIAASGQYEVSFMMVDIDFFKRVNDHFGHAAGDEVLAAVAKILSDNIRATDFAFRMGGEEFLLVLKGASLKIALGQALLMLKEIEAHIFEFAGEQHQVTASFGVATFTPPFDLEYEEMISLADKKLFESKNKGRNQVSY